MFQYKMQGLGINPNSHKVITTPSTINIMHQTKVSSLRAFPASLFPYQPYFIDPFCAASWRCYGILTLYARRIGVKET